jgi:hypothetical protein
MNFEQLDKDIKDIHDSIAAGTGVSPDQILNAILSIRELLGEITK